MANFDPSQNRNPWADCNKIPAENQVIPASRGLALSNRMWNNTTLRFPKQHIWFRTALCGGCCRHMALRNLRVACQKDDYDNLHYHAILLPRAKWHWNRTIRDFHTTTFSIDQLLKVLWYACPCVIDALHQFTGVMDRCFVQCTHIPVSSLLLVAISFQVTKCGVTKGLRVYHFWPLRHQPLPFDCQYLEHYVAALHVS